MVEGSGRFKWNEKISEKMDPDIEKEEFRHTPHSIDIDEQVKKYAAEDARVLSERVAVEMDSRHLETLKEQVRSYSREEQLAVASVIKTDVLLEALGLEFARLNVFEERIRSTIL